MKTESIPDQDEISRIAGRMVHRATDGKEFLIGIESQINFLKTRIPEGADGYAEKLQDLADRWAKLSRAIADYEKAEKIIRCFGAILWEAKSGLEKIERLDNADAKELAGLMRRAVTVGEDALK